MIVPERSNSGETIGVYSNGFFFDGSRGCIDETCYRFIFDAANKAHRLPAKQSRACDSESELQYERKCKSDNQDRKCFTRTIWNNAVIYLQNDQWQPEG